MKGNIIISNNQIIKLFLINILCKRTLKVDNQIIKMIRFNSFKKKCNQMIDLREDSAELNSKTNTKENKNWLDNRLAINQNLSGLEISSIHMAKYLDQQ
jgi:hypothetical protein